MASFAPSFHGFDGLKPGTYHAVLDMPSLDENGMMRIPYIYDPSGASPFMVTIGI